MIHLDQVSKYYNNHCAINKVSLKLAAGEMAFLTGHSGAGKSTILKLIMLMTTASDGQIFVEHRNLQRIKPQQIALYRRQIGMVFQNPQLLKKHTVFDNIALPLVISGMTNKDIKKRVRAALDKVGLIKKESLFPHELSYGEQQRIGIARAVVHKPKILLADEPTGNLDPMLSEEILNIFSAFNAAGTTVFIATHDLVSIAGKPNRIITLKDGELLNAGHVKAYDTAAMKGAYNA